MAMELEGTPFPKFDTQKLKDTFQKREFVLETMDGSYPQKIKFELTQEKCPLIDTYNEGDKLKVSFNIRGSEWQGKYFVNLQAWRIDSLSSGGSMPPNDNYMPPPVEPMGDDLEGDLPF